MKYAENIPREQLSKYASDDMLIFTAFISIFIGFALLYMGIKGRQLWMIPWSIGLVIFAIFMGVSVYFEIDHFNY
jgi:hypothetical protein